MAGDISSEDLLKWTFWLTFVGALIYIAVVFTFVIGRNSDPDILPAETTQP